MKDDKSVSPVMRPSAGNPGERLSGCLAVLGARTRGTGPLAPRVTEKHIQEELVFLLTFKVFFNIFFLPYFPGKQETQPTELLAQCPGVTTQSGVGVGGQGRA